MKFDKTTALALGLAGTASANWADWASSADPVKDEITTTTASTTWADWTTTSGDPVKDKTTTSTTSANTTWADWTTTKSTKPADASKTTTLTHDPWADWSSSAAVPADESTAPPVLTVTVTETETAHDATTTVYRSAFFVGPGEKTKTIYPSTCAGSAPTGAAPGAPGAPAQPAGAPSGSAAGAPGEPGDASGAPVAASSAPAAGGWGSDGSPDASTTDKPTGPAGAAPSGGWGGFDGSGPLNPGIPSASIVGINGDVYSWTDAVSAAPRVTVAPTYSGWGDWSPGSTGPGGSSKPTGGAGSGVNGTGGSSKPTGGAGSGVNGTGGSSKPTGGAGSGVNGTGPAPGSDASNVTAPFKPLKDSRCNSASDRSKWCGAYSIDTDYYSEGPSTDKVCSANWVITNTTLNFDGVDRLALAINGQVPGPLLECNWGDTIQVTITNKLQDNATTIHWHGILQKGTNDQDGVPGITECAVAPGETRTYTFKASQYGTGWYHSHVYTQYGDGIRGPMVIHGPATSNYDVDAGTVMIDDIFGTADAPMTVAETNARIAHFGPGGSWNYLLNGANTFPDLSKGKHALWKVQSGKKYLFRIINSASQNVWSVHFDNHNLTVIAADYVPIVPYETEWLNIGNGQRYDVIVEMNQPKAGYFLRAVVQTGCPSNSANDGLGSANGIFVYDDAPLTLPTSTAGGKVAGDFAGCSDEPLASIVPYLVKDGGSRDEFQSSVQTMPAGNTAVVNTTDDGLVFRWFINNGAINVNFTQPTLQSVASGSYDNSTVSNYITLNSVDTWVYFVIQNQFFAAHSMHLHGHDMFVLGQGNAAWNSSLVSTLKFDNPVRRDTAMLAGSAGPGSPAGYTVIGFQTDNPGAWLMHCHLVWHVDGGLALQWIERPSEIDTGNYVSSSFKSECSALSSYEAEGPWRIHSGSSGLKARTYFDDLVEGAGVVRRELSGHSRRGISGRRHGLR